MKILLALKVGMLLNQFERLNFKVMEKFVIVQNIDFTISKFHCLSHIDEYEITFYNEVDSLFRSYKSRLIFEPIDLTNDDPCQIMFLTHVHVGKLKCIEIAPPKYLTAMNYQ